MGLRRMLRYRRDPRRRYKRGKNERKKAPLRKSPPFRWSEPSVNALPAQTADLGRPLGGWRLRAYTVIFESDTQAGRLFDLVAVLPTWAALFVPGLHALIDVRLLRLLRLFRILKLAAYVEEFAALGAALMASRRKILVFLSFVLAVVIVMGSIMYVVEGPANGFTNIPVSVYWAISTMTTVGFGDITPKTGLGRFITSFMMLIGWGTLAVPTGIVSAEFTALRLGGRPVSSRRNWLVCLSEGHAAVARFCRNCGCELPPHARPGATTTPSRHDSNTDPL